MRSATLCTLLLGLVWSLGAVRHDGHTSLERALELDGQHAHWKGLARNSTQDEEANLQAWLFCMTHQSTKFAAALQTYMNDLVGEDETTLACCKSAESHSTTIRQAITNGDSGLSGLSETASGDFWCCFSKVKPIGCR
mmetsp:Transcript_64192/g.118245  ORF Transcript_64192/g.118245 Transcript_64192/m.118245 type:complete len:138 (+) Transcript_64192:63-476(+)